MKRPFRCSSGVCFFVLLVAGVSCLAPTYDPTDPWPVTAEDDAADSWSWGAEANTQPTRAQLESQETAAVGPEETSVPDRSTPPLYAFDGSVVDGPTPGAVTEVGGSRRELGKPGDRWHIIELYQAALKERDELADEVATLATALERAYLLLDQSEKNGLSLTNQVGTSQTETERLRQENADLAARLTTAQIRRLEAEKMLLEAQIEAYRLRAMRGALGKLPGAKRTGELAMGDG